MRHLFETNHDVVYLVYGLVFLLMGFAAALQSRTRSQLSLGRHLWLLAAFGLTHGTVEWGYLLIPFYASHLPETAIALLTLLHAGLQAVSFFFLLQFGCELLASPSGWRKALVYVGWVGLGVWGLWFFVLGATTGPSVAVLARSSDAVGRYAMALPGAASTALGLVSQSQQVEKSGLARSLRQLRGAAVAFGFYAIVGGFLVADPVILTPAGVYVAFPGDFFLIRLLNAGTVERAIGIPAPVFRSIAGAAMAFTVVRALKLFDVETEQMIESMERERILSSERERIGRELHDGIIQSIYAAGLALQDAAYTVDEDPALARTKIQTVLGSLDHTIGDIRNYIMGLRSVIENQEFEERLRTLVEEFASTASVKASAGIRSAWRRPLNADQTAELLQIAHEALANVARHAKASHVELTLEYGRYTVSLEVTDDGVGFDPAQVAEDFPEGHSQGLSNMAARADLLGGSLQVHSAPGQGTRLRVEIPYQSRELRAGLDSEVD